MELHFYVVEASRKLLDLCTMRKTLTSIQGEMLLNHLSYVDSSNGIQIELFGILVIVFLFLSCTTVKLVDCCFATVWRLCCELMIKMFILCLLFSGGTLNLISCLLKARCFEGRRCHFLAS